MVHIRSLYGRVLIALCCACGCLSVHYRGETFPPTEKVEIFAPDAPIPPGYRIIGRVIVSGEWSGTTGNECKERLLKLAQTHGADAVIFVGSLLQPEGERVDDAWLDATESSADPDEEETELAISRNLGDAARTQTQEAFQRQGYAVFLRRTTKDSFQGSTLPSTPNDH